LKKKNNGVKTQHLQDYSQGINARGFII